jgi:hypothetical protein
MSEKIECGERLWSEDDVTVSHRDHETLADAYDRITGLRFSTDDAVRSEDHGDGTLYEMPTGHVVWASYPGNSSVYAGAKR